VFPLNQSQTRCLVVHVGHFVRVRTFYTTSSRADTARTRRRLLRPALAPAPLRERAGRLARDTVARMGMLLWLRPGQGSADCAEPYPQPQARCASRSVRPLMCVNLYAVIVTVVSGSGRDGPDGSGVNSLTLGPYGSWAG
jgi:hypothetical protein